MQCDFRIFSDFTLFFQETQIYDIFVVLKKSGYETETAELTVL